MKYLDHFKNISLTIPDIAIGLKKDENGNQVLNTIGKPVYVLEKPGTVINMIRKAYGLDPIPSIEGLSTIDRFQMFRLVSSVIDGNVYHSHWYYRYPSIIGAMSLFTPYLIGNPEISGNDLKTLIFPYVRLIESQNRINFGITENDGLEFETLTALQKISTKKIKLIDRYAIGNSDRIQQDRISRFTVGSNTPSAISQNINFVSSGDRYSRSIEYRSYSHVIQISFLFNVPGDRSYKTDKKRSFCKLASIVLFSYSKITGEKRKETIGSLEIESDRILRIRLFKDHNYLESLPGITPEISGYLLSMIGFRRSNWKMGSVYIVSNIPNISPFSDIPTWNGLGITIQFTKSNKVRILSYIPSNHALKCEVIKNGKNDPIVQYI